MAERLEAAALRPVSISDLIAAVAAGLRDFRAAPRLGLALASFHVGAGWLLMALLGLFGMPYLAYPTAMGFALIAPFAAVGFYAVSDHLERHKPLSFGSVLGAIRDAASRDLRWMALVTGFALVIWMDIAAVLTFGMLGFDAFGPDFLATLLTTPTGLLFLAIGHLAGGAIAAFVFSISAVSFPMLYDRDVDFVTAMTTSARLVLANPVSMIAWCAVIAVLTGLSILSAFVGLLVVLPIVGHATWHLYRHAVVWPAAPVSPSAEAAAHLPSPIERS